MKRSIILFPTPLILPKNKHQKFRYTNFVGVFQFLEDICAESFQISTVNLWIGHHGNHHQMCLSVCTIWYWIFGISIKRIIVISEIIMAIIIINEIIMAIIVINEIIMAIIVINEIIMAIIITCEIIIAIIITCEIILTCVWASSALFGQITFLLSITLCRLMYS